MSHFWDLLPATPDPPSVLMVTAQGIPGLAQGMDGHQLVQWLT